MRCFVIEASGDADSHDGSMFVLDEGLQQPNQICIAQVCRMTICSGTKWKSRQRDELKKRHCLFSLSDFDYKMEESLCFSKGLSTLVSETILCIRKQVMLPFSTTIFTFPDTNLPFLTMKSPEMATKYPVSGYKLLSMLFEAVSDTKYRVSETSVDRP